MPSCHCLYPNYVPWVYETFSDCIYTTTDQVAFYFGLSSMAFWLVCQLPQFIKNCRRKSAEALSLCFLVEWLGGDILNFTGSVLTGMLPTQVWLAGWFVVMDVFILGQYIYLYLLNRGRPKDAAIVDSDSDAEITEPLTGGGGGGGGGGSGAGRGGKRSGTVPGTINAATAKYGSVATTLATRTSALEADSSAADAAAAEAAASRPGASALPRGAGRARTTATGSAADSAAAQAPARRSAVQAAAASTSAGGDDDDTPPPAPRRNASLACGRGAPALSALSVACVAMCVALPAATRPDGYWSGRATTHAGSAVRRSAGWHIAHGIMSAAGATDGSAGSFDDREVLFAGSAGASYGAGYGDVSGESRARRLEIHSCVSNTNATAEDRTLGVVGDVFGWISSALYLTSRLPQVYKNYQRGSVEGLSWLMFLCAFLGNTTALIGILPRMSTQEDWASEAPFLPGMMGTIVLDFTIMFQWFWYTARATRRRAERKQLRDAAKRAAGGDGSRGGGAEGGVLGAPTGAEAALLLDTPDLISANARRGLYDMVESPPPPRSLPAPVEV
ncbi:hypothetical protein FNF27_05174 [Cafeteria roenbergensis]|uniref:Uncharacterized protein n=1 Tax=Cafeteria roenbergensis TaxID=33653 RepID=A0A5A8E9L8_CAFRO|nr:hypothetical protein FNF27_05174 [Cafeteria roenbergensis]